LELEIESTWIRALSEDPRFHTPIGSTMQQL